MQIKAIQEHPIISIYMSVFHSQATSDNDTRLKRVCTFLVYQGVMVTTCYRLFPAAYKYSYNIGIYYTNNVIIMSMHPGKNLTTLLSLFAVVKLFSSKRRFQAMTYKAKCVMKL